MCQQCDLLTELYEATEKTPRLYWVMTELFVMLHGGDVCPCEDLDSTGIVELKTGLTSQPQAAFKDIR